MTAAAPATAPRRFASGWARLWWMLRAYFSAVLFAGAAVGLQMFLWARVRPPWGVLLLSAGIMLAYVLLNRFVDRRVPIEFDPKRLLQLVPGIVLGCVLASAAIGLMAALGAYHIEGWTMQRLDFANGAGLVLSAGIGQAFATGVFEESLFRGYFFRWIAGSNPRLGKWKPWPARWSPWVALGLTSLTFGCAHAFNPHATPFSSIAIALEAGVLLGAAYWVSGTLWFPIGIHAGWNFAEGALFGVPVSGRNELGVIAGTFNGPAWLTGGSFGIEASPLTVLVGLAAALPMLRFAARRRIVPVR